MDCAIAIFQLRFIDVNMIQDICGKPTGNECKHYVPGPLFVSCGVFCCFIKIIFYFFMVVLLFSSNFSINCTVINTILNTYNMKRSHDNEGVNYDVEWHNKTKCNIR